MNGIYQQGYNCWKTGQADKAALLIDCANYYKALYEAIRQARHSIFITGWDIDGRIELLRGKEAEEADAPVKFFELIRWKAEESSDLKIYLNRWNYSIFFTREREPFSGWKWHMHTPSNVYYCADYQIPFGACHHQKVIVVDDRIAFCGGMDIALGRWDHRQHHVEVKNRVDPGFLSFFRQKPYEPYHDIQFIMSGPVVSSMAELVRQRWKKGAGFDAIPSSNNMNRDLWPEHITPDFENVEIGIARTLPKTRKRQTIQEVLHMYLSEISKAEKFIYLENQYLTCEEIAAALNKRMKEKPELRVLIVSSDHPRGFMEHKAMWTGRVKFCDMVTEGVEDTHFAVTYPVSQENGSEKTIHIHSKIMVVDDKFLHVGSANLNNRSMGFDTECDVVVEGKDPKARERITALRNNLIREHTGREEKDIAAMIENSDLPQLLEYQKHSRQHLRFIDNEPYRGEFLMPLAKKLGDPYEAHILSNLPVRQILFAATVLALFIVLFWSWLDPFFSEFLSQEKILGSIEMARDSQWSILWVAGIYIMAGAVFFPVTVLNLTTAIVFGPFYGIVMGLTGSVASASTSFVAGRMIGKKALRIFRPVLEKIQHYAKRGGVMGMTVVRMVPIAPFTLVNLTFGISKVPFGHYILATILGLLPGIFAKAMFGGAVGQLWADPEPRVVFYTVGSLLLWIFIVWLTHRVASNYTKEMQL